MSPDRIRPYILLVTAMTGMAGMGGQLVLMRELMIIFLGNELILGLMLSNWLIVEAAGAWLGGKLHLTAPQAVRLVFSLTLIYAIALPLAVLFSRDISRMTGPHLAGESPGMGSVFLTSFILAILTSLIHGALFPLSCQVLADHHPVRRPVGTIYVFETAGTFLAGTAFSLLLLRLLHAFLLSLVISLLCISACVLLLGYQKDWASSLKRGLPALLSVLILIISTGVFFADTIQMRMADRHYPGQTLSRVENTRYGQIALTRHRDEQAFYYSGRLFITDPYPDLARISDYANLAALAHPQPKSVCLIGGGLGGLIEQLLFHPLEKLVYCEIDDQLIPFLQDQGGPVIQAELQDPRLTMVTEDGRLFMARTRQQFDLVVLGLIHPETIQTNRLFTFEFFLQVQDKLAGDGLMVLTIPGSDVYLDDALLVLSSSLYQAARQVFAEVMLIPGEHHILIASDAEICLSAEIFLERSRERGLDQELMQAGYLDSRLDPVRRDWATDLIAQYPARPNYDLNPAAFFYSLIYWGRLYTPGLSRMMIRFDQAPLFPVLLILLLSLFLIIGRFTAGGRRKPLLVRYMLAATGVMGMAADLLILFLFQAIYGVIYQLMGLLMAVFLGGTWLGSRMMTVRRRGDAGRLLQWSEVLLLLLPAGLAGFVFLLSFWPGLAWGSAGMSGFIAFSFLAGTVTGAQFPLAAEYLQVGHGDLKKISGTLYAADLLGGWLGGLALTLVLYPILGFYQTVILLFGLKLTSLLVLRLHLTSRGSDYYTW